MPPSSVSNMQQQMMMQQQRMHMGNNMGMMRPNQMDMNGSMMGHPNMRQMSPQMIMQMQQQHQQQQQQQQQQQHPMQGSNRPPPPEYNKMMPHQVCYKQKMPKNMPKNNTQKNLYRTKI